MTQNKNDLINSILQHGHVVDNNCGVVFPTSRFPYLILCPRECKWKVATIFLAITTKISCCLSFHKLQEPTSNTAITEKK